MSAKCEIILYNITKAEIRRIIVQIRGVFRTQSNICERGFLRK